MSLRGYVAGILDLGKNIRGLRIERDSGNFL